MSVCLSVSCLPRPGEWKGLGSSKLGGWKSITQETREKVKVAGKLMHELLMQRG